MRHGVAVVGPTASGKTGLALGLAAALGTEIVSADSMQFYRGMEIGTGAPTAGELARAKHHFVGHLAPDEEMSAGMFEEAARAVVLRLNAAGKPAVVVGGSGLYVRALIDGLFEGPAKDEALRRQLEAEAESEGPAGLYARLVSLDPAYAKRIEQGDLRRIVRALEVHALTGRAISELHVESRERAEPLDFVQVALDWPREILYERINRRVDGMVEAGLLEEVRRLIDGGYGGEIERLKALGYREIAKHLRGECSLDSALENMKMHTRRYAKRQLTWFRGDRRICWIEAKQDETVASRVERVLDLLETERALQS